MSEIIEIGVNDVQFEKELYPRLKADDAAIERYRDSLDKLPPIKIARDGILVDGYHRWQAHKRENKDTIRAENLGNLADTQILKISYKENAKHGQQLSTQDKKRAADQMYRRLTHLPMDERYADIAEVLSLNLSSAKKYCAEARQDEKREQQARAWDLWLECWTQTAIAEEIGVPRPTVIGWVSKMEQDSVFDNPPASRQHFDVWQFNSADKGDGQQSYFGALPPQVMENLLWLFTEPGQTVVDLFAGSGTTVDVCKRMGRRVWASDIKGNDYSPLHTIHTHNAVDGWPDGAPGKADLIFLDPPYWRQARNRYSDNSNDLANVELDEFMDAWAHITGYCNDHLNANGKLAYIISPSQTNGLDGRVIDHATEMCEVCRQQLFAIHRRIIVPYNTQQVTGAQVDAAREKKKLLAIYRDLVVMEKAQ